MHLANFFFFCLVFANFIQLKAFPGYCLLLSNNLLPTRLKLILLTHITSSNPHLHAKAVVSGQGSGTVAVTAGAKALANPG